MTDNYIDEVNGSFEWSVYMYFCCFETTELSGFVLIALCTRAIPTIYMLTSCSRSDNAHDQIIEGCMYLQVILPKQLLKFVNEWLTVNNMPKSN